MYIYTNDGRVALKAWKGFLRRKGLELGKGLRRVSVRLVLPGVWQGFMEGEELEWRR